MTREEQNRKLAEWLFGRSLDGFGIYSAGGSRLRDRAFDSREEAQRYIDSEDERLTEPHKAAAHGVNIRPCVKTHPDFFSSEEANALLKHKIRETIPYMVLHRENGLEVVRFVPKIAPILEACGTTELEAICLAALALIEQEEACKSKS